MLLQNILYEQPLIPNNTEWHAWHFQVYCYAMAADDGSATRRAYPRAQEFRDAHRHRRRHVQRTVERMCQHSFRPPPTRAFQPCTTHGRQGGRARVCTTHVHAHACVCVHATCLCMAAADSLTIRRGTPRPAASPDICQACQIPSKETNCCEHVCGRVCGHVCGRVCGHAYAHVCRHAFRHVHRHVYRPVYRHAHGHSYRHVCRHVYCHGCGHVCRHVWTPMWTRVGVEKCIADFFSRLPAVPQNPSCLLADASK